MNKIIYIGIFLVLVLGAFLFSGNRNSTLENSDTATSTDVMATTTATSTATTTEVTDNTKIIPKTAQKVIPGYPTSWPSDVPRYPTEVVKYTGGNNPQSGPVEATVIFTTRDSVKSVVNFYLNGLRANGWKITEDGNGLANLITLRAVKAKRGAGVYVERTADGKTTVTVGVNIGI